MVVLMYVLSIFFSIVPAFVLYMSKKNDAFVYEHAAELLNFGVTVLVACLLLMFVPVLGWLLIFGIGTAVVVLMVMGIFKAQAGEAFRFPLTLRFVGRK